MIQRGRELEHLSPTSHWLRLPPVDVNSEHVEKVLQERGRYYQVEGRQAHTEKWCCLTYVPGTVLHAGDTAGNETERVLLSWNSSAGETGNK